MNRKRCSQPQAAERMFGTKITVLPTLHVEDPLGGFLTTKQLARRDQIVFSLAKTMGIPVVWNLAGGYQEPVYEVLKIHNATMRACIAAYA
jgi:hypothetical protein